MISRRITSLCRNRYLNSHVQYTVRTAQTISVKPVQKNYSEIEIKVPWGKVTGKLWGSKDVQPILAVHGWQDNASSFDKLAPLLLKHSAILAIDLPGHGLSSWMPPGAMYNEVIYVLLLQRLKTYFGWEKLKILAHSLGAQITFWYTSVFPEQTDFVIALDALKIPSFDLTHYNKKFAKAVDTVFKIESITTPPIEYTEEEILKRWAATAVLPTEEIVFRTLIDRGTTKLANGKFIWNRDPKLKVLPIQSAFTHDHLQKSAELIICPYLVIKATESSYFEDKKYFYDILEIMKKNNKHVYYERITGGHHVHVTHPEDVANVINPFLDKYNV